MIIFKTTVDGIDIFEKSPDFLAILNEQNLPEEQVKVIESLFAVDANIYVQKAEKKKEKNAWWDKREEERVQLEKEHGETMGNVLWSSREKIEEDKKYYDKGVSDIKIKK